MVTFVGMEITWTD